MKGGIFMPTKDPDKLKAAQKRANDKRDNHHTWEFVAFVEDLENVNSIWLDDISKHPERRKQDVFPLTLCEVRRKLGYEIFVSPLHKDNDFEYKLHRHIIVHSNNKISMEQSLQVAKLITITNDDGSYIGIPMFATPRNLSDALRYALHLDDRDKPQYSPNDFVQIDNCEPLPKIRFTAAEIGRYIYDLCELVNKKGIKTLHQLAGHLYCTNNHILYFMLLKNNVANQVQSHIITTNMVTKDDFESIMEQVSGKELKSAMNHKWEKAQSKRGLEQ